LLSGVPWQYAIAGIRGVAARLRAATVSIRAACAESAAREIPLDDARVVVPVGRAGHEARRILGEGGFESRRHGVGELVPFSAIRSQTLKIKPPRGLRTRRASANALALLREEHDPNCTPTASNVASGNGNRIASA